MTPEELFKYADRFARRAENAGKGTKYPTFRQAAKRFKVRISDVEDACNDWCGEGYMGAIVAIRVGSGVGGIDSTGDYQVEAYK